MSLLLPAASKIGIVAAQPVAGGGGGGPWQRWRILVDVALTASGLDCCEIELLTSGVDQTGSGTASASSEFGSLLAGNAFDNDMGTRWASNFSGVWPQWIEYDFGSGNEKTIDAIKWAPQTQLERAPGDFTLQHWDGASWVDDKNWISTMGDWTLGAFTTWTV